MTGIARYFCAIVLIGIVGPTVAADRDLDSKDQQPVIQPEVERREVTVPRLHPRDFEVDAFAGYLNIEDFGTRPVYGGRLAYHFTEHFFVETTLGKSEVVDTSFRRLGISVFEQEKSELIYYNVSWGVNLFPGEIFFGSGRARYSYIYLIGGVGVMTFDVLDNVSFNVGLGVRVVPFDWLSLRFEVRDHIFESDLLGVSKTTNNLAMTLGLSFLF